MARKSKESEKEYQKKYYEEHIKNNPEAREKKNARQREYIKRTGYSVNNNYNKNTYTQIMVREKKEVAEAYKEKCNSLGIPYSQPLHEAIENFLKK